MGKRLEFRIYSSGEYRRAAEGKIAALEAARAKPREIEVWRGRLANLHPFCQVELLQSQAEDVGLNWAAGAPAPPRIPNRKKYA